MQSVHKKLDIILYGNWNNLSNWIVIRFTVICNIDCILKNVCPSMIYSRHYTQLTNYVIMKRQLNPLLSKWSYSSNVSHLPNNIKHKPPSKSSMSLVFHVGKSSVVNFGVNILIKLFFEPVKRSGTKKGGRLAKLIMAFFVLCRKFRSFIPLDNSMMAPGKAAKIQFK